jgi:hypothetical protein
LIDRETGELVPQDILGPDNNSSDVPALPGKSKIVLDAKETGSAILIQDLTRSGYQNVVPMRYDVKCALALPLLNHEHCIGVLELQSPGVAVFKDATVDTLKAITLSLNVTLEDAWLFESGWLVRQVREGMRHLWDDLYLGRMALADWALSEHDSRRPSGARGECLRDMLTQAVESLKSLEERNTAQGTRCYNILNLTYVKELAVEQIIRIVNISRRQYFYELKDSIEILTDRLIRDHSLTVAKTAESPREAVQVSMQPARPPKAGSAGG